MELLFANDLTGFDLTQLGATGLLALSTVSFWKLWRDEAKKNEDFIKERDLERKAEIAQQRELLKLFGANADESKH